MQRLPGSVSHLPAQPAAFAAPAIAGPRYGGMPPEREVDLLRYWRVLVRRRAVFFGILLGFLVLVTVGTVLQPKSYTTQVRLIAGNTSNQNIQESRDSSLPLLNVLMNGGVQTPETLAELLHETPVSQSVVDNLKLGMSPERLLSRVTIKPVTNTSIIGVSVSWPDREMSAKIANEFASVAVERERTLIAGQATSAIGFLREQMPIAQERLRAAQNALAEYERKNGIADLATQTTAAVAAAATLDAKESGADLEKKQAQAELENYTGQLAHTPQFVAGPQTDSMNPVVSTLNAEIAATRVQLANARANYTDAHPVVQALREQLASEQAELAKQPRSVVAQTGTLPNPLFQQLTQQASMARARIAAATSQLSTIGQQRKAQQPLLQGLPDTTKRVMDLRRDSQAAESVYMSLQKKYQEAIVAQTTAPSDITITQAADPRNAAKAPNIPLNLTIGLLIGLILALTATFGLEFFDDRFRSEDDVKDRIGLPVLATIPKLALAADKSRELVESMTVEAFFQLVTSLRYSSDNPPHVVAVTSPKQGDGKSTVALNTAISMASLNARVLVIDADLRRPTIHQKLGLKNDVGLSDVLVGMVPFEEVLRPSGHPGVWIITSGLRPPNPVALLQGESFDRVLAQARERFDFVILDSPALESIIDGVVLAMKADGAVLVVSATGTDSRSTRIAIEKLRSVSSINMLGVVLNQARAEEGQYSDYYLGSGKDVALAAGAPNAGTPSAATPNAGAPNAGAPKASGPVPEAPPAAGTASTNGVPPGDFPRQATAG
jgi:capsular exopolysaccharide synthesis family protein